MTHPAYLLARLNAKNVRFDVGVGGIPDLTPEDIAGALGMVPAGIGRDLLCLRDWPDTFFDVAPRALKRMNQMLMNEWMRRESDMNHGMLAVAMNGSRGQQLFAAAHSSRWPSIVIATNGGLRDRQEVYPKIAPAVIVELIAPNQCGNCGGRGVVGTRTGPTECSRCKSSGIVARGNTQRAEMLGIGESDYRRTWDRVYTWLLEPCSDLLVQAGRRLSQAAA